MKRFIQGECRTQSTPLPELLDDYIADTNPVRVVDVFVDELDLGKLGFEGIEPAATRRPAYHPASLLKIYIYGYLNRVQSSRRLEKEAQRNIELMWLTGRLMPDFKTIADFRKDNGKAIRSVCRQFVVLCQQLGLFSEALVAIDGSKFKAVNNRDRNFTSAKLQRRMEEIESNADVGNLVRHNEVMFRINRRLDVIADDAGASGLHRTRIGVGQGNLLVRCRLKLNFNGLERRHLRFQCGDLVLKPFSPELRHGRLLPISGIEIGQVTMDIDRDQLSSMAKQDRAAMGTEELTGIADRGYFKGEEILACQKARITAIVPKTTTSGAKADGRFDRSDFIYDATKDEYLCPAGQHLIWRFAGIERGLKLHRYWSSNCQQCPIKEKCTPSTERRIARWAHEDALEAMQNRLDHAPDSMRIRRQTVDHPFGTIKLWMGSAHFLTKTLKRVSTEMSLHVLAYNLKRVMKILGPEVLMAEMRG